MKTIAALLLGGVALVGFAGAHRVMEYDGATQWESAAYMVWAGRCERGEVLCKVNGEARGLDTITAPRMWQPDDEYIACWVEDNYAHCIPRHTPRCSTDTECEETLGASY